MPDVLHPALRRAVIELDRAAGGLNLVDQDQHDQGIVGAVDALNRFFLHIDATSGEYDPAPIYLDRSRVVFGLLPGAVEPLISFLERRSNAFTAWANESGDLPDTERHVWEGWIARLNHYRAIVDQVIASTGRNTPSELLFFQVVAPLVQGIYPTGPGAPDWVAMGISDPAIKQKPDVVTLPTTIFVTALHLALVDNLQLWLLEWSSSVQTWVDDVTRWLDDLYRDVQDGLWSVGKTFLLIGGLVGVGLLGWKTVGWLADRKQKN